MEHKGNTKETQRKHKGKAKENKGNRQEMLRKHKGKTRKYK